MRPFAVLLLASLAAGAAPPFPLRVSDGHRHLFGSDGKAFFLHGDTAWSLVSGLTKEDAERYLEDRRLKGFNAIIVNLVEHKFNGPVNRYGEMPFRAPGDFAAPSENYFSHADWVLQRAKEKGILVLLAPMYLGYKGIDEGWYEEALTAGPSKCAAYGTFLGRRYRHLPNIVWMMGGDRDPEDAWPCHDAMARAIRAEAPEHLMTAHAAPEHSGVSQYGRGGWLDLNTVYTYGIVHKLLREAAQRKPPMPFVMAESTYEGEHNASTVQIRRQAYWSILSGAAGHFLGNKPIWGFFPGWENALDAPGSMDMARLRALFLSRPWHDLEPDFDRAVVTMGEGEHNGMDFLTAARTRDASLLIAYMPDARTIRVDLSKLAGARFAVWWYNPRTGSALASATIPRTATHDFTPPGEGDWIFLLEDAAKKWGTPGVLSK